MRRTSVVALMAGLVLSTVALPAAGQTAGFSDVPPGNVHAPSIERSVELGLVQGTSETTFSPGRSLTRAQSAAVLERLLERLGVALPALHDAPRFSDTGPPHEDAIRRLAAAGIVRGQGDGSFGPQLPVRRDQLASLVVRTVEYAEETELSAEDDQPFDDVRGGPHAEAVAIASELGLLLGKGDGRFDPFGATRRDQATSVLTRLHDRLAGEEDDDTTASAKGEVWVLDQGTDTVHIYDGDAGFAEVTTIDLRPDTLEAAGFTRPTGQTTVPHMIEFDSQDRYAFIASTAGGVTIVVDARTKQVVEVLRTGAGTHMAAVTPDDSAAWIAAIGARQMVEIPLDLDADDPTFAVGRRLDVAELLAPLEDENGWEYPSASPVCHQYDVDSTEAWITLGPSWNQGGLVVLDLASGTLVEEAAYDPAVVKANCGVSVTEDRVLVNWSGKVTADEDTRGEWYVIDPSSYDLEQVREANGFDTHGLRLNPEGTTYWQVNRISDEAMLIDAETLEVVREIDDVAVTPDILDFSPDGAYVYITQRGPNPRSGAIHAATGDEPGLRVVDTATGETVTVLEQPEVRSGEGAILNDVHGVGVRVPAADDTTPQARGASARTQDEDHATVQLVATRSASSEAPRPEPTNLGFHCGLTAS
jgi:DNA-binding beta-propeller fold protein YncE